VVPAPLKKSPASRYQKLPYCMSHRYDSVYEQRAQSFAPV